MTNAANRCINPAEITSNGILAFAMGEAGSDVRSHIERCSSCRTQAQTYARASNVLSGNLFRAACLTSIKIGEYVLGTLQGSELRQAAEHLAECPHCLTEKNALAAFMTLPDEPLSQSGLLDTLQRLFLRPVTAPSPALSGLRGATTSESVTYVDPADRCHVLLSVQPSGAGRRGKAVAGLLEQRSGFVTGKVATLYEESRVVQTDDVDDLGNFLFTNIPNGNYRIEVTTDDLVAVIEDVQVS
jgi:predicted RNA-binding Zn-ribbon protein involved in translation (DUF1610 family)